ncbi:NAD-dependent epimerase/dehydratase [Rhodopseudomonas palustris HaA2]|uniref:GDP-L-fucose synthase n=1 Tax=Rhodopseudomonas palustris (strain HaA2) TaxID=316058 RepID=Q2IZX2_RHOP2|nr:GDP-L-fucose synthase [Rhodopseudomonas palustris]ABD06238.1 NAD-dependent epimerase/dehydratase [Rhodopseudomonas palustris HaA2]
MAGLAFDLTGRRVWVAGHRGMLGSALVRRLSRENCEILTVGRDELDLRHQTKVQEWFSSERPDVVILAAARVGGVLANSKYPASFLSDNLSIQDNVIQSAAAAGVKKLLFVSSSCVYPRLASQPIEEDALLTGALEPTNRWYGVAKIAGMMQCAAYREQYGCDFIAAVPGNLYGPGDYFDKENSHVIPAFLRRFHDAVTTGADEVAVWGSGTARREFVFVDECADALVFLLRSYSSGEIVNIGSGVDVSISELAHLVADVTGFRGRIAFDTSQPEGAPRRLLSTKRLGELGWQSQMQLREGLSRTYQWFLDNHSAGTVLRGYETADTSRDVDTIRTR